MESRRQEREVTCICTAVSDCITAVRIFEGLFYGGTIPYVSLGRICTAVRIRGQKYGRMYGVYTTGYTGSMRMFGSWVMIFLWDRLASGAREAARELMTRVEDFKGMAGICKLDTIH